jgi:hypothetical protein
MGLQRGMANDVFSVWQGHLTLATEAMEVPGQPTVVDHKKAATVLTNPVPQGHDHLAPEEGGRVPAILSRTLSSPMETRTSSKFQPERREDLSSASIHSHK